MVSPDLTLARQLTALDSFAWAAGMLAFGHVPRRLFLSSRGKLLCVGEGKHGLYGETTGGCVGDWSRVCEATDSLPDLDDPATGGCLLAQLGPEAWRVRYSPSMHKQAAGTPWTADLTPVFGPSCVTLHASLGRACAAVLVGLAGVRDVR